MLRLPLLVLALLGSCGAVAAPGAPPAAAPAEPKPRLVCSTEPATGSHIKRRTCMTEAEHKERQRRDQERVRRAQDREFKTNVDP